MKVYNTLTRKKETLVPISGNEVRIYSCGPTVYSYAHIGNLRAYIFMDELRRAALLNGFTVKGVMNITDVGHLLSDSDNGEDKMQLAAKSENQTPWEIAKRYTDLFMRDINLLNIGLPEIVAKATDHIDDMLEFVKTLVDKGYGYETSDGIYFDISKFSGYGKLSGAKLDENIAGARVEVNTEKRNAADFALWKKAPKEHIMQWDSPWGKSYPGWHIECSAMSRKYLGDTFDIHTGGVDHIPIHHENEIAQSEALLGRPAVNIWMHGEFMQVDGGKMSKSLGNTYRLEQLIERGYSPMDFRYFCLNTHYRKKLNFTFEAMDGAKTAYRRLLALLRENANASNTGNTDNEKITDEFRLEFKKAISDDLNYPLALGLLWTLLKNPPSAQILDAALWADKTLALSLDKYDDENKTDIPENIRAIADKRWDMRANKDWAESDRLRAELTKLGWTVKDSKDGYELTKI